MQSDDVQSPFTQQVFTGDGGTHIQWEQQGVAHGMGEEGLDAEVLFANWEKVPLDGYLLPLQTFTLQAPPNAEITVDLGSIESIPWAEEVPLAELPDMRSPSGGTLPAPIESEKILLPQSPLFILREGMQRGERFVVMALSPFYTDDADAQSTVRMATRIVGFIPQTTFLAPQEALADAQLQSPLTVSVPLIAAQESPLSSPLPTPSVATTTTEIEANETEAVNAQVEPEAANMPESTAPPTRNLNLIGVLAFAVVLIGAFGLFLRRRV